MLLVYFFWHMAFKFLLKKIGSENSAEDDQTLGEYALSEAMFTVGSDDANSLILEDTASEQAVIVNEGDHLKLINSASGTFLNGKTLKAEAMEAIVHGDEIVIGDYVITVVDNESDAPFKKQLRAKKPILEKSENGIGKLETSSAAHPTIQNSYNASEVKSSRNFAAVLNTLRTEEDRFYFIVKNKNEETGQIPLENAEMPIGANSKGKIVFDILDISTMYGVARKDWSGILLESQRRNSILINGKPLETTQRLRNEDRVTFSPAPKGFSLMLHEPSLLVALEPLLAAKNSKDKIANEIADRRSSIKTDQMSGAHERTYFGHFSFIEVLTMIIGTLIGAVIIFLLFEYLFVK